MNAIFWFHDERNLSTIEVAAKDEEEAWETLEEWNNQQDVKRVQDITSVFHVQHTTSIAGSRVLTVLKTAPASIDIMEIHYLQKRSL